MAQLGYSFDPDTAPKEERSFEALRPGWYPAQIIESDVLPTKSGNGIRLTLTWEITEGEFARRRVWQSLNVQNSNPAAQEFAQRDLRSICEAIGWRGALQDSRDLEFKPCEIRLGIDKENPERNTVKTARPLAGSPPSAPAAARQPDPPATSEPPRQAASGSAGGARPWSRGR